MVLKLQWPEQWVVCWALSFKQHLVLVVNDGIDAEFDWPSHNASPIHIPIRIPFSTDKSPTGSFNYSSSHLFSCPSKLEIQVPRFETVIVHPQSSIVYRLSSMLKNMLTFKLDTLNVRRSMHKLFRSNFFKNTSFFVFFFSFHSSPVSSTNHLFLWLFSLFSSLSSSGDDDKTKKKKTTPALKTIVQQYVHNL